jgi:hypothetical protein
MDLTQNLILDSKTWFKFRLRILKYADKDLAYRWKSHREYLDRWMNLEPNLCPIYRELNRRKKLETKGKRRKSSG